MRRRGGSFSRWSVASPFSVSHLTELYTAPPPSLADLGRLMIGIGPSFNRVSRTLLSDSLRGKCLRCTETVLI